MMSIALRSLEFCLHCLDGSPWPWLLAEILENYAMSVEGAADFTWMRAAGRLLGPSTRLGSPSQSSSGDDLVHSSLDPPEDGEHLLNSMEPIRRTLLRLQVRWTRGLEMEAAFWRKKLSLDPSENVSLERLKRWLVTGQVNWFLDGDDICGFLVQGWRLTAGKLNGRSSGIPRILNAGSGPLAPAPLECSLEPAWIPPTADEKPRRPDWPAPWQVPVLATDGLARFYQRVMDEHKLLPPHLPIQCPVEELHSCFPAGHFDVVHMRNALDHVFDPLLGIQRMLHVTRPGGWVLLRHAQNEGVAGKFRNGLHQWAFDTVKSPEGQESFLIWNPYLRLDVTASLLETGVAAEVKTELRAHPSADAPADARYVWVDIRKPTLEEAAARRVQLSAEADRLYGRIP